MLPRENTILRGTLAPTSPAPPSPARLGFLFFFFLLFLRRCPGLLKALRAMRQGGGEGPGSPCVMTGAPGLGSEAGQVGEVSSSWLGLPVHLMRTIVPGELAV